jgi:nitrate/nitrite transport system substrate-binding protein
MDTAKQVYLPAVYQSAASELVAEGKATAVDFPSADEEGFRAPSSAFIDGLTYDGRQPNAYINQFRIGLKADSVQ